MSWEAISEETPYKSHPSTASDALSHSIPMDDDYKKQLYLNMKKKVMRDIQNEAMDTHIMHESSTSPNQPFTTHSSFFDSPPWVSYLLKLINIILISIMIYILINLA